MSRPSLPEDEALSPVLRRRIDQACNRFEAAQRGGAPLPIEDFLDGWKEPDRSTLLRELVLLDLDYRRGRGERCRVEDYKPFPTLDPAWLADALADDAPPLPGGTVTAAPGETVVAVAAGQTFGDFEILEEIGRGGMGVVYKARQVSLKRVVALKMILSGEHAGPAELARFRAEARAIAQLQHPNIVQIHEVGEHGGRPFFALEFCPGGNLDKKLHGTPLPAKEAARLVEVLARAMHAAHGKDIVHRDLKPANVLLAADGTVKITDFGLAKVGAGSPRPYDEAGATQSGAVMGTPSYMAPEQAAGKPKEIGPAADVYALGAILYEGLTGRPPFKAATVMETLKQVLQDDPVPPRQLQPKTPRDLETICLKCLRKEPAKRYADAEALAKDLERFLAGKPIEARPVGAVERGVKWVRRRPAPAALALVSAVAALALVGVAVGWVYGTGLATANADLETAKANLQDTNGKLKVASDKLQTSLAAVRDEKAKARRYLYLAQMTLAEQARKENQIGRMFQLLRSVIPESPEEEDLRGWDWYRLWRTYQGEQSRLSGHQGMVTAVAFSPDERLLASGGADKTVRLWDSFTGKEIHVLKGHTESVTCLAFSPDGKRLVSGSADKTAKIWDTTRGQELRSLEGHDAPMKGVAFSPDGRHVYSGSEDRAVRVWDVESGQSTASIVGAGSGVMLDGVAFSPTDKLFAWATGPDANSGTLITVCDRETGVAIYKISGNEISAGPAFSPDSHTLAYGTSSGKTMLLTWDPRPGPPGGLLICGASTTGLLGSSSGQGFLLAVPGFIPGGYPSGLSLQGDRGRISAVTYSPDGKQMASAGADGTIKVWDTVGGHEIATLREEGAAYSLAFSPDGRRLASATDGGMVKLWALRRSPLSAQEPKLRDTLKGHTGAVNSLAFGPDGKTLASGSKDGTVKLWDAAAGKEIRILRGHAESVTSIAFSPDGRTLASGSLDKTIRLWEVATGKERLQYLGHEEQVTAVTFSPDGRTLASGSADESIRLWSVQTVKEVLKLSEANGGYPIAFSPDGKMLASAQAGTVQLWDSATGRKLLDLEGKNGSAGLCVAFSPDGKYLATGDCYIVFWDPVRGKELRNLLGPEGGGSLRSVAFSPDGKSLASIRDGDWRGDIHFLNVLTGEEIFNLRGHRTRVNSIAFSPNGKTLASGSEDGTIELWDIPAAEQADK